ncbi:MAG: helix-turn-helix transcriptional regulator [Bacteroidales bacterium]|jgi:transcriptional regulator with XRE-family HTH domain|nr:helix-turn-helix domain-containing protein [Bacteroidales bacterium]MDD4214806.1 helix-turn-helix transcriptional regulator [Bacteroidales bacterium]
MLERILLLLKIKNLSPSKFADQIGIQRSSMSHIMSERNQPSLDLVMKILNNFKDISPDWLLMGQGQMLKTAQINLFDDWETKSESNETSNNFQTSDNENILTQSHEILQEKHEGSLQNDKNEPHLRKNEPTFNNKLSISNSAFEINLETEKIVIFYKNNTYKEYYPSK